MIGKTNAGLGGLGGRASAQSTLPVPTLGSLATSSNIAAAGGKENLNQEGSDTTTSGHSAAAVSEPASNNGAKQTQSEDSNDAHVIDNSPSFARSSPSSTFHADDTLVSSANSSSNNEGPLPTPSPTLAAALVGSSGEHVPPSPIRTLQDPWTRSNENGGEGNEFADLSSIGDLTRDDSIITATSVLVGDLDCIGEVEGTDSNNSSGGGIAGQKLTFASTTPSKDGNEDSKAEVAESELLKAAYEAEQALVRSIGDADPTSALHEHYQSIGRANGKPKYRDVQHRDGRGIVTGWWRSVLSCPVMEKDYYSGLPHSLWLDDNHGSGVDSSGSTSKINTTTTNGWSNILTKLGEYAKFDDGYVYFKSKKGARKSAALCAYEAMSSSANKEMIQIAQIMCRSESEATAAVNSLSANPPSDADDKLFAESPGKTMTPEKAADTNGTADEESFVPSGISRMQRGYAPRSSYPAWVERLHRLGVDPSSILIEFREKLAKNRALLQMNVSSPLELTAVSRPFQSRAMALESASLLVAEEIRRQNITTSRGADGSHTTPDCEAKEGLIRSYSEKNATFIFPPPLCFTAPIEENNTGTSTELLVYELDFKTESGSPFISTTMGISPNATTRMAVVFGQDIFPDEGALEARQVETLIDLPTRNGVDKVKVTLCNRTVLHLAANDVHDKIRAMKRFNTVLCAWKQYGLMKWSRSLGSVSLKDKPKWAQRDGARDNQRTCLFVPLRKDPYADKDAVEIDWNLIRRVESFKLQPYFLAVGGNWRVPGMYSSRHVAFVLALSAVVYGFHAADINQQCALMWSECMMNKLQNAPIACMWLVFHAFVFLFISFLPPKRTVDKDNLKNRFLLQSRGKHGIFVVKADGSTTIHDKNAYSMFPSQPNENGQLAVQQSLYDLYLRKYQTRLRYPNELVLSTNRVTKHEKEDLLRASSSDTEVAHVPPELVHLLPCPRDMLYVCGQHMAKIMLPLERAITLLYVETRMEELRRKNCMKATTLSVRNDVSSTIQPVACQTLLSNLDEGKSFLSLLDEATSLSPHSTYQRLEFLGDAVLNYFLSIDLMARNAELKWDANDLGEIIQVAMNNKTLGKASLRIGLSRLLGIGGSKWKSAYNSNITGQISPDAPCESSQLRYSDLQSDELSEKTLSDVVESLLAVAFINSADGSIVAGLLDELELPGTGVRGEENSRVFHGLSACLGGSYPFELQKKWNKQIVAVGTTMIVNHGIDEKLERGLSLSCGILEAKLSLRDSIASGSGSLSGASSMALDGLDLVGILRDTLFFVGNYALNLCISIELYKRFPGASPKDLTLLNFCAFTDDILSYILVKSRLYDCLYDQDST
eukprot:CAMPEP_0178537604 /NCGR_PEP_ID=MMETSP0696-20121128/36679_1 /TAXON_ID=265572 /ORGANISM="Extubocellulus spinifer, Strain CCMP396" /LENGTH=1341 /DNA_ID=CAMNT_0020169845 /DNA_START=174 /DNA_END=4198 /DNA_ORIENTATION=+